MEKKKKVVLLLGSNIEPRIEYLRKALELLQEKLGRLVLTSAVYESAPWGFDAETSFLNQTALFETEMDPLETLDVCLEIEKRMGRVRELHDGYVSRTLDVDILYCGKQTFTGKRLTVPHPRLHQRRFALVPLSEMIPRFRHPVLKKTQGQLLAACRDLSDVKLYTAEP